MAVAHNLPLHLTSFVGREREQAEVRELLAATRLLTLTGAGGIGKTRLALRVAETLEHAYGDRVWLVELASLHDGAFIPQAIAPVLGIHELAGRRLAETLTEALRAKQLLLLLDNCEHLLPACAELIERLLRTCPLLRILATSREVLGVAGEKTWRVPPLSLPASPALAAAEPPGCCEAVQLFVDRARLTGQDFALSEHSGSVVVEICRRLDGIPLAIELAAARTSLLDVDQIAARLEDRFRLLIGGSRSAPARQQTLRATIAWSYDLLTANEQRLFDRLSVFSGGWALEAAEAVAGGDGLRTDRVLELLGRLVGKSLVLVEPGEPGAVRYRLLETLRRYGQKRLGEREEAGAIARRHAAYFLAVAEQAERSYFGPREQDALRRLEREQDNVRAALRHFIASGDVERGQRLGAVFGMFCFFRSALMEGRSWLRDLLALPGGDRPTTWRATCLFCAADLALGQGDHAAVQRHAEESLALWRHFRDDRQATASLYLLGLLARMRGDYAAGQALLQDAVELGLAAGNAAYAALGSMALADMATAQGDYALARSKAGEAMARATALGWGRGTAGSLRSLASACYEQDDDRAARAYAEECVEQTRKQAASPWWLIPALATLGQVATAQRDFADAAVALRDGLALARDIGDLAGVATGLLACADLAAARGRTDRSIRLAAAAAALRERTGGTIVPVSARVRRRLATATARQPERAGAARQRGQGMSLEEAIAEALAAGEDAHPAGDKANTQAASLSPREREVAALVARGCSNLEIAEQLVISERTVESHVRNILGKFALRSRARLASWAVEHRVSAPPVQ
jgi:predicted ATPase/DNA-binding CsgD family transcriptional regulator